MADLRTEVRTWLEANLTGEFADARGLGGPGREHESFELRRAWERRLGAAGWTCLGWPMAYGGRDASLGEQVIFYEEYAEAAAPQRVGHIGEGLIGPTIIEYGTAAQRERFLPPIRRGDELWCQGYSEPDAGSDLANVSTRAERDGDDWVLHGQKVWTSLAHVADWCFVLCRTEAGSRRHHGLSYLLVPMDQPGIEVRPIVQLTGTAEFNEVFFDGARTAAENIVGAPGDGWRVAMATLGYERGASTLGQQIGFRREYEQVVRTALRTGAANDPVLRDRLVSAWIELEIMRLNALRTMRSVLNPTPQSLAPTPTSVLNPTPQSPAPTPTSVLNPTPQSPAPTPTSAPGPEVSIGKLYWSEWHRRLGELGIAALGREALLAEDAPYELGDLQRLYLFSRADTIYAGSSEIQRNVIAERTLGLPREPKG